MPDKERLAQVYFKLGYKPLNRTWAKLEILLGLAAAGAGIFLGEWFFSRGDKTEWDWVAAALLLFILGGYLALAGSRSHLYQSNNELTALIMEQIDRSRPQG